MISKRRRAPLRALGLDVMRAQAAAAEVRNAVLRDHRVSSATAGTI